ncbi:methyltransferase, putative [hydrothermal vent metagenome]|uniref:Methyltransferase, putative n=1 Tax=hydrothermal vent metagenome TaxID=652676 RepID=A0A3B0Z6S1_9ZZZZ
MTDIFEERSKDYDANDMIKLLSSAIGRCIIKNVELNGQMQVLDFGAGTGLISSQIAPYVKKITAVDISQSMLDKLIAKQEHTDKIQALCQDITIDPIGTKYDLIMSAMAMHHVEDIDNLLKRFSEHLKSGAKIALADLDKEDGSFHPKEMEDVYHEGFERRRLQSTLEKHGFKNVNFETAHTINGETRPYPIFLVLATKT